jgi:hypothetical protein
MSDKGQDDPMTVHATVRHQPDDVAVGRILIFAGALLLLAVVGHLVPLLLYGYFVKAEDAKQAPLPPLAAKERLKLPRDLDKLPAPVLRANDTIHLEELRRKEDARLQGYGWVDPKAGVVHVPIEEAMKKLADPAMATKHGIRIEAKK